MPDPITGLIVGGTQLVGGMMQADAAGDAAAVQAQASEAGIAEQRRQFDAIQQLFKPYIEAGGASLEGLSQFAAAGAPALQQQQALLGLQGQEAQRRAISAVEQGGLFQELVRKGEESILQQASATGGLRGGNVQAALAQFRPQMLSQAIADQYSRLGGLTALGQTTQQNIATMGQASAAGQATAGLKTAADIAGLQAERGAALAGGELGQAKAYSGLLNLPAQVLGAQYGAGGKLGLGFGSLF